MSRTFGRIYDVNSIAKELQNQEIPKYKKDGSLSSWDEIGLSTEKIEIYLPEKALEFLESQDIKMMRSPFRKYTFIQIPEDLEEERIIRFPSLLPKNEFKRELMFYIGALLSSYNPDDPNLKYEIPNEYDDLLSLLLEYLYLKDVNQIDRFSIKHLNELSGITKGFIKYYKDYEDFDEFKNKAKMCYLNGKKLEKFKELCADKDIEMEDIVRESLFQLSSLEGALRLTDMISDKEEIKKLIEELMLNERGNRSQVLLDRGIESYGYPRLRKELNMVKKK